MKRQTVFPLGSFLMMVLLALAGCRAGTPAVTAMAVATSTTMPAATLTRSITIPPTVTQTPRPTRKPTVTKLPTNTVHPTSTSSSSPTPLVTSLFPVSVDYPSQQQTSTPIVIPESSSNKFKLKTWSEADSVALIQALDKYAEANDLCFPAGCIRNNFVAYQEPISLMLKETIWRFPNTSNLEQYQWRLALTDAIWGSHASDEWLLAKLEELLNQTRLSMEVLNDYIEPHGFTILTPYFLWDDRPTLFPNLFGDQENISVYRLTTLGSRFDGLFFAVRATMDGKQELIPIYSDWNFNTGNDYIEDYSDHNLNGLPELIFSIEAHSGTMCIGDVLILEWQGDKFVQRVDQEADRKIHITDCQSSWGYSEPDENNVERLYVHNLYTFFIDYFKWDGNAYRFDERKYQVESADALAIELDDVTESGRSDEAIKILEQTLPSLQDETSEYGPNIWDYFYFQLGLFYAIESRTVDAKAQFQSVANTPTDPAVTAISQAAQAFLDHYDGSASIYVACNASLNVMQEALTPYVGADGNVDAEQTLQAWGYKDEWPLSPLCNLDLVLPSLIRQFSTEQMVDTQATLQQAGVNVEHSSQLDIDGDSDQDWIVVVTKPQAADRSDATVWALVQEAQGFIALRVSNDYDDIDHTSAHDTFAVETATLPAGNGESIILVHSGNGLFAFQVLRPDDSGPYIQDLSGYWWRVTDYLLESSLHGPRITITYPDPDDKNVSVTKSYLWDGESYRFNLEENVLEAIAERAVQSLWQESKAAEAIPALQAIVNFPPSICDQTYPEYCDLLLSERSRYHYLLALAYELTGDETAAVQTYWQLWHDFPHSPYALMARAKLER